MSYYKRKNDEAGISTRNAVLAVLMAVVLFGGFMARDTLQAAFFEHKQSIDVTGEWLGIVTEDYDAQTRYEYRLNFEQNADGTITGYMNVQSTNRGEEIVATSMVSGTMSQDDLTFNETRVTYLEGVPASNWCMISVTLDHEVINGQETMTGSWMGIETPGVGSCVGIEGRVIVTRDN
jgi:hypothetical protein